jgi:hypothetical protein
VARKTFGFQRATPDNNLKWGRLVFCGNVCRLLHLERAWRTIPFGSWRHATVAHVLLTYGPPDAVKTAGGN